jgi:septum formation protein
MGVVQRPIGGKKCRQEFIAMIYLASTSPRRKKILKELGIRCKVIPTSYKEHPIPGISPSRLVKVHALEKGLSALRKIRVGIVISADTVVYFNQKIVGKPKSINDAFKTLKSLQGRWHSVYTGVAILNIKDGKLQKKKLFHEKTYVHLKKMSDSEIRAYFKKINPLDKAGSYAIQSKHKIVDGIKGSFYNAMGLPERGLTALEN